MNKFDKLFSGNNQYLSLNNFIENREILLDQTKGTESLINKLFMLTKHKKEECSISIKRIFAKKSGVVCGVLKTQFANYAFIVSVTGLHSFYVHINNKKIENANHGDLILFKETGILNLENVLETLNYADVVENVNLNVLKLNNIKSNPQTKRYLSFKDALPTKDRFVKSS